MAVRRLQALDLMGRIAQQALETEAAALSALRGRIAALTAALAALHADLQAQGQSRSLEAALYMPDYLRAARLEQARIGRDLAALRQDEARLEAAVARRFQERKTYALVLEAARQAGREAALRAEAAALDDHTLMRHGLEAAARLRAGGGGP